MGNRRNADLDSHQLRRSEYARSLFLRGHTLSGTSSPVCLRRSQEWPSRRFEDGPRAERNRAGDLCHEAAHAAGCTMPYSALRTPATPKAYNISSLKLCKLRAAVWLRWRFRLAAAATGGCQVGELAHEPGDRKHPKGATARALRTICQGEVYFPNNQMMGL